MSAEEILPTTFRSLSIEVMCEALDDITTSSGAAAGIIREAAQSVLANAVAELRHLRTQRDEPQASNTTLLTRARNAEASIAGATFTVSDIAHLLSALDPEPVPWIVVEQRLMGSIPRQRLTYIKAILDGIVLRDHGRLRITDILLRPVAGNGAGHPDGIGFWLGDDLLFVSVKGTIADARALVHAHRGLAKVKARLAIALAHTRASSDECDVWRRAARLVDDVIINPEQLRQRLVIMGRMLCSGDVPMHHAAEAIGVAFTAARTAAAEAKKAEGHARVEADDLRRTQAPALEAQLADVEAKRKMWQHRAEAAEDALAKAALIENALRIDLGDARAGSDHLSAEIHTTRDAGGVPMGASLPHTVKMLREMAATRAAEEGPRVGVSVIVRRGFGKGTQVLVGKRKGAHGAGEWSVVGGHLRAGEGIVECAVREVGEETGIVLDPRLVRVMRFYCHSLPPPVEWGSYITVWCVVDVPDDAEATIAEPEKCEEWRWVTQDQGIPTPRFRPVRSLLGAGINPWESDIEPSVAAWNHVAAWMKRTGYIAAGDTVPDAVLRLLNLWRGVVNVAWEVVGTTSSDGPKQRLRDALGGGGS